MKNNQVVIITHIAGVKLPRDKYTTLTRRTRKASPLPCTKGCGNIIQPGDEYFYTHVPARDGVCINCLTFRSAANG